MKLLILGGTIFLGRHVVEAALARGHEVTLFNRGTRPLPWHSDVHRIEQLVGDRDIEVAGGLDALDGRRWDAVVDTCGFVPRLVGAAAAKLAGSVEHYTFVSSVSAYRDFTRPGLDEEGALATMDDPESEDVMADYGALKVLSERAAEAAMPGRCLHVRAGLIVGPFDETGRFGYWLRRVAEGGEVLAPGRPDRPIQFIDVRDLAQWIVTMAEARRAGVYNATGPALRLTMGQFMEACRSSSDSDARFTWVDDAFLIDNEVAPFTNLPLWLPPGLNGLIEVDVTRAIADGLRCRPLATTVEDTKAWLAASAASVEVPAPTFGNAIASRAGLSRERERALLDTWAASRRS